MLQVAAAAATACFVVSLVVVNSRTPAAWIFGEGIAGHTFFLVLVAPILLRARHSTRHRGVGWLCIVAFVVLFEVGSVTQLLSSHGLHTTLTPGLPDACYLASLVALGTGIAWLTQRISSPRMLSLRLDGAVVGFAVGSVAAAIHFQRIPRISGGALQVAVAMSHPTLDLTLLMLIVAGLALHNYRPHWHLAVLMLGATACVAGDVVDTRGLALHANLGVPSLNLMWMLGLWLVALASWADPDDRAESRTASTAVPSGLLMLPIGSGLVALSVIVVSLLSHVPRIALVLATCSLLLVIARMTLTLREARQGTLSFRDARTDELTGLSNRRGFIEAINARLDDRPRTRPLAVLLVDLNGFKEVNDSLGHLAGDELLTIVGKRFGGVLGADATIARIGGDEFAMAFDVKRLDEALAVARRLAETHADQLTLDGVTVRVSASYGVALFPAPGRRRSSSCAAPTSRCTRRRRRAAPTPPTARSTTATAARASPSSESSVTRSSRATSSCTTSRHATSTPSRSAASRRSSAGSTRCEACSTRTTSSPWRSAWPRALSFAAGARARRSPRPRGSPGRPPAADERQHLALRPAGRDAGAVHRRVPAGRNVPGDLLTLEITESSIGDDPERSRRAIEQLRGLGIRVSIDDFGVGYSSMSQLLSLPLDEIKIDKSFILALKSDRRARAIISSAIELAKALDLTLVAEGIETEQSLSVLQELGADIGQGFYIARPLTSAQLDDFLTLRWDGATSAASRLVLPEVLAEGLPLLGTAIRPPA